MSKVIDGKAVAAAVLEECRAEVGALKADGITPGLAVVLVGEDPASQVYVGSKVRTCGDLGIYSRKIELPTQTTQEELLKVVADLNADPAIHGILVQSPPPKHIDEEAVVRALDPRKDVDGFHAYNIGRLALRRPTLRSCTPMGVMQMLDHIGTQYKGSHATIIGASNHVGRPMSLELLPAGVTVTTAHKFTTNTEDMARQADILISAVGKPGLVPGNWVKEGATVIDVGITRGDNNKLFGDIEFDAAKERAAWITPVPGGVGPMTRVALLQNTMQAAASHLGISWKAL